MARSFDRKPPDRSCVSGTLNSISGEQASAVVSGGENRTERFGVVVMDAPDIVSSPASSASRFAVSVALRGTASLGPVKLMRVT